MEAAKQRAFELLEGKHGRQIKKTAGFFPGN